MKKFIAFLFVNELKTKYSAGEEVTKFKQKGHSNPQQVRANGRRRESAAGQNPTGERSAAG